jgi:hypothetical protein
MQITYYISSVTLILSSVKKDIKKILDQCIMVQYVS